MGNTRKPCPGCGETSLRDADSVCRTCEHELAFAKGVRQQQKNREDVRFVKVNRVSSYGYSSNKWGEEGPQEKIQKLFTDIAMLMSDEAPYQYTNELVFVHSNFNYGIDNAPTRQMPGAIIEALCELDGNFRKILDIAYKNGYRNGSDLIGQLTADPLAAEKYNDISIKTTKE